MLWLGLDAQRNLPSLAQKDGAFSSFEEGQKVMAPEHRHQSGWCHYYASFNLSVTDTDSVFVLVQLEQDIARQQKEEQQGTALQTLPDSNIFFLDKVH